MKQPGNHYLDEKVMSSVSEEAGIVALSSSISTKLQLNSGNYPKRVY